MRVVIPSVDYADMLAVTLPAWQAFLGHQGVIVASTERDTATAEVVRRCGAELYVTDAWMRTDASHTPLRGMPVSFNKGLALDEAFGFIGPRPQPADGELCVCLDADVVPFGTWPAEDTFGATHVDGCQRYRCDAQASLEAHRAGRRPLSRFPSHKLHPAMAIGYCQVFRWRPGIRFGSWPTAEHYDVRLVEQYAGGRHRPEWYVLHLGPWVVQANWKRRVVPRWVASPA